MLLCTTTSSAASLAALPQDLLYKIIFLLHRTGASLQPLAHTCRALRALVNTLRGAGEAALPINLHPPHPITPGIDVSPAPHTPNLRITKTSVPGDAYVVFQPDITQTSALWHLRIERLNGHRIDIGVATRDAFRFGMVERKSSWSFDCFGRACVAGTNRTYGRQMRAGDVVGVLYDASRNSVSFLDNGVSMGELPLGEASKSRVTGGSRPRALFPYVYLPYRKGEAVTLLGTGKTLRSVADVKRIHASSDKWRRPPGLPYDGRIIVGTWEERKWYALDLDPATTPLASLWRELEARHGMPMRKFELIFKGRRLENRGDRTLSEAGICIDTRTGTCSADVLLSVPHIVS